MGRPILCPQCQWGTHSFYIQWRLKMVKPPGEILHFQAINMLYFPKANVTINGHNPNLQLSPVWNSTSGTDCSGPFNKTPQSIGNLKCPRLSLKTPLMEKLIFSCIRLHLANLSSLLQFATHVRCAISQVWMARKLLSLPRIIDGHLLSTLLC